VDLLGVTLLLFPRIDLGHLLSASPGGDFQYMSAPPAHS